MAEKRMFSRKIVESDAFLDMPLSTQALYFHLNMEADDDGFVNSPKRVQRLIGASEDDFKILLAKRFILAFESGVIVVKHWRMNNYIQSDRYKETVYLKEKAMLKVKKNKSYTLSDVPEIECIQNVYKLDTQTRLDKIRLEQNRLDQDSIKQTNYTVSDSLTMDEFNKLDSIYEDIIGLIDFVDDSINARDDKTEIKNPYKYVVAVAEANYWQRKIGGQNG